jgi:hypothetical protein
VVRCPTQKQTFIAHLGAALQNATSPASYSLAGLAFMRIL